MKSNSLSLLFQQKLPCRTGILSENLRLGLWAHPLLVRLRVLGGSTTPTPQVDGLGKCFDGESLK